VTSDAAAELGRDADRIDAAIAEVTRRAKIDRKRVVLLGFSDGASYGLCYGLAMPEVFKAVLAMAPGYVAIARRNDPAQLVFVAHGRQDSILPFTNTRDSIVPSMEASGLKPKVYWFDGDHTIDRAALEEGLDYALGAKR
jgi:predicted esterase